MKMQNPGTSLFPQAAQDIDAYRFMLTPGCSSFQAVETFRRSSRGMHRNMTQTSMTQILPNGWPKRFLLTVTAYDVTRAWEAGTRFILSLLTLTILLGLAGGVVKTFLDLRLLFSADLDVALRHIIVDALTLLAVVEVLRTTLTYCSDGRVRVTFIVDTVLVVMLTEIISRWFTGGEWHQFAILGGIVLTLGLMRVVAIRYSPAPATGTQQAGQPGSSGP